ncbi:hypothetical protein GCM10009853_032630 [Glycomyces scopariae]|uniref:hypothetical protein n=1 Tax=Glycomyces sambucus TaxID=380244 RepID=UPI00115FA2B0|nr:hypothetical protein [Glycomyces sambucus]
MAELPPGLQAHMDRAHARANRELDDVIAGLEPKLADAGTEQRVIMIMAALDPVVDDLGYAKALCAAALNRILDQRAQERPS